MISLGDLDEDLSDRALREQPIFGSESSADDASDFMADALGYFITTMLHDSMMGLDTPLQVGVKLDGDSGAMLTFQMFFWKRI